MRTVIVEWKYMDHEVPAGSKGVHVIRVGLGLEEKTVPAGATDVTFHNVELGLKQGYVVALNDEGTELHTPEIFEKDITEASPVIIRIPVNVTARLV